MIGLAVLPAWASSATGDAVRLLGAALSLAVRDLIAGRDGKSREYGPLSETIAEGLTDSPPGKAWF